MIIEMPVRPAGDTAERERALDPSRSFIVEAPAGSGKTGLLVQRFLRLLATVQAPESVVAMTFTRKAAAEMKDRVLQAFEQAQSKKSLSTSYEQRTQALARAALDHDRVQSWRLLTDPSRLQILTIDALCASLTRQMPLLSNFGGSPAVQEGPTELYRIAARRMLRTVSETPETQPLFQRVSLHFENDLARLEKHVAAMLEKRDQWQHILDVDHSSPLVADFQALLAIAAVELRDVFRQSGQVDFTEITQAAIASLGTPDAPTDLLFSLDYRIEHLLVDEFQDTSRAQYSLLEALTGQWSVGDGHTLFLVGDPMQSIYGFREADVGLFLDCWDRRSLGSVPLSPVTLTRNFRSTPELINWIQKALAAEMSRDDRLEGAVSLRRAEAVREPGAKPPQMHPFVEDADGLAEANDLVDTIRTLFKKNQSIAVLVRARAHIFKVLPLLRAAGIPYEAVEIDPLAKEQHILDLLAIARALVHTGDRVAWLACLRAPWCGLPLADLSRLAEHESHRTILELLSDPAKIASLAVESRFRAVRAQEILSAAVDRVGRQSLRALVEETWIALGAPAIVSQSREREDVDACLDLLEQYEEGGIIRDFSLLNARLETLFAKPLTEGKRIQILTIHKAKGLEFDAVLLPRLDAHRTSEDSELLIWHQTRTGLHLAALPQSGEADPAYKLVKEHVKKRRDHENVRLLYVAMTRARNELHLFGCVGTKQTKGNKAQKMIRDAVKGSHLACLWNEVGPQFVSVYESRSLHQANLLLQAQPKNELRRLPSGWRNPQLDSSVQWEPSLEHSAASTRKISYEWVSDTARHVGTIVHEFLKRMAADSVAAWGPQRVSDLDPLIISELLRLGVPAGETNLASRQVVLALTNTLTSTRGRWIFENHREARSEWPITGRVGNQVIVAVVDRVFRAADDRFWIVDFKTSQHQGASLSRFLDEEQRRYRIQLENYAALAARLTPGPISLGLYFPLLDAWREWNYDEALAAATQA